MLTNFQDSTFTSVDFRKGNFYSVVLTGSRFTFVSFKGSKLQDTSLEGASLSRVNLQNAAMEGVNFTNATMNAVDLRGSDLRLARGLTSEMLEGSFGDETTKLPDGLSPANNWRTDEGRKSVYFEIPPLDPKSPIRG